MIGSIAGKIGGGFLAAALLTVAVSGTTLAGRTGSSPGTCQRDGWTVGQRSNGTAFTSKDACLAYTRLGGTVYKPSFTFDPSYVIMGQGSDLHVTGFHANSKGTLHQHILGGAGSNFSFLNVPTNSSGNMAVIGTVFGGTSCADGVYGAEWDFTDEYGVHASGTIALICLA